MAKSEDNGDNWTLRKVIDFPIDKYVLDSGIDTMLIPDYEDAPSDAAVFSSDGTGDVKVDVNGKVHLVYGRMYLEDAVLTDDAWQYYPGTNGINYWNEDFDDNELFTIAGAPDLNGNDSLDINNTGGTYFTSLSSQASLGFDENNNIFCLFSAVNELYVASANGLNYRHAYLITSQDGGETWDEEPLNVLEQDEDLQEFIEGGAEFYYPQMAKKVDHKAHIIVQADAEPGIYVNSLLGGPTDDTEGNTPNLYWYLGQNNILSSTDPVPADPATISVFPNPTSEKLILKMDLVESTMINFQLFNNLGNNIYQANREMNGSVYEVIDMELFPSGIYYLKVHAKNGKMLQTLPIIKE
jgi:hypothetical protein